MATKQRAGAGGRNSKKSDWARHMETQLMAPSLTGVAVAWLPILFSVAAVYAGMEHMQEGIKRPPKPIPVLHTFNILLKLAGPLFPFFVLATRFGLILLCATYLAPGAPILRYADRKIAVIFVAVTLMRVLVYALTLLSPHDTMSDHILLGVSMAVLARIEFHAALDILMGDSSEAVMLELRERNAEGKSPPSDSSGQKSLGRWRYLFIVPLLMSVMLMACCHGNNYVTSRWFHSKEESLASVMAGLIIFEVPMSMWMMQSSGYSLFVSRKKAV